GGAGAGKVHLDLRGPLLSFLGLGLVAIKPVGAEPNTKGKTGSLLWLQGPGLEFGHDRGLSGGGGNASHGGTAQLHQIAVLEVALLACSHHDQTWQVEARGREDLERRAVFAGEAVG